MSLIFPQTMATTDFRRQDGSMLGMMIYAVCGTLTAAGLWFAMRSFRRRRYAIGLRTASIALLPIGLAMTGVVKFVVNMTINPIAWMGFGVLGVAVVLFMIARLAEGSGARGAGGAEEDAPAAAPAANAPALPQAKRKSAQPAKQSGGTEDFSDIEDILKRHGI
jgi:vacuolar-type H+-ATPase subunit I/STV1